MSPIVITLSAITLITSTCFGYMMGKHIGFQEGIMCLVHLISSIRLTLGNGENAEEGEKNE